MATINIKKKNIFLLAAILIAIAGIGYTIAIGAGDYTIHGHDSGEIEDGLSTYESTWFQVNVGTTYTKPHGLGKVPFMVELWVSDTADGSGRVVVGQAQTSVNAPGLNVVDVDNADIKIRATNMLANVYDADGNLWQPSSGYVRIKAIG